jgi:hypothetical protein
VARPRHLLRPHEFPHMTLHCTGGKSSVVSDRRDGENGLDDVVGVKFIEGSVERLHPDDHSVDIALA